MAYESTQVNITLKAGVDLSGFQYQFVKLDADGDVIALTSSIEIAIGVLQNQPNADGERATICVSGITKLVAGAAINEGESIAQTGVTADFGQAKKAVATQYSCGVALTAATGADKRFTALINTMNPPLVTAP